MVTTHVSTGQGDTAAATRVTNNGTDLQVILPDRSATQLLAKDTTLGLRGEESFTSTCKTAICHKPEATAEEVSAGFRM